MNFKKYFKKNNNEGVIPELPFPTNFKDIENTLNYNEYVKKSIEYIKKIKKIAQLSINKNDKLKKEIIEFEEKILKLNDIINNINTNSNNYQNDIDILSKKLEKLEKPLNQDLSSIKMYFENYFKRINIKNNDNSMDKLLLLINRVNLAENELKNEKEKNYDIYIKFKNLEEDLKSKQEIISKIEEEKINLPLPKPNNENNINEGLLNLKFDPEANNHKILENKINLLEENNINLEKENEDNRNKVSLSFKKVKELEESLETKKEEYKNKFKEFLAKKKDFEEKIKNLKNNNLNCINEIQKFKNTIKNKDDKIDELQKNLNIINDLKNENNNLKVENDFKIQELNTNKTELVNLKNKLKDTTNKCNELKILIKDLNEKDNIEKKYHKINKILKYFIKINEYVDKMKDKIIDLYLNLEKNKINSIDKLNTDLKVWLTEINNYLK